MDAQGKWAYTVLVLLDITKIKTHEVLHHRALQAMSHDLPLPLPLPLPLMRVLEQACRQLAQWRRCLRWRSISRRPTFTTWSCRLSWSRYWNAMGCSLRT